MLIHQLPLVVAKLKWAFLKALIALLALNEINATDATDAKFVELEMTKPPEGGLSPLKHLAKPSGQKGSREDTIKR
jgi:hypothetical protein